MQQPNIVPEGIDDWQKVMDEWGTVLVEACRTLCAWLEQVYAPLGFPKGLLTERCASAPHLLAPTGMQLAGVPKDTICAGYHYDIDLLTIHGKSRFPGLYIWTREGKRVAVRVPPGYLLV